MRTEQEIRERLIVLKAARESYANAHVFNSVLEQHTELALRDQEIQALKWVLGEDKG